MEAQPQYVGIDLHRRRSVIVHKDAQGTTVDTIQIGNDPVALAEAVAAAGEHPEVILEASYGWYWAADVLAELGASVHLAHPLGNNWGNRRVKNDERDAADLVDLLRLGRLAEAYVAAPGLRELRELVRHRAKMVAVRSGLKAQVHAVLAKEGVAVAVSNLFGVGGRCFLDSLELADAYRLRVDSLLELIDVFDREVATFEALVVDVLADHPGYQAIQTIPGVGPVLGAIFVAEIGDVGRFSSPAHLCSWAGMTPKHRESDTTVHRGRISRARAWCAGRRSRRSDVNGGPPPSARYTIGCRSGATRTGSVGSPPPASCSSSSSTACATATSVAWPRRDDRPGAATKRGRNCHDPRTPGVVAVLIDPFLAAAEPLHATTIVVADR